MTPVPSESPTPKGVPDGAAAVNTVATAGASPLDAEDGGIVVAVRCRPLSESEVASGAKDICRVMGGKLVILLDPGTGVSNDYLRMDKIREKRYAFDHAFGQGADTSEVFKATAAPLMGAVQSGYNASVFAYGSTGAGKTFTMIGTRQSPGVMLRTVEALFAADNASDSGPTSGVDCGKKDVSIRCSFVEVYNENLRDLLVPLDEECPLDLREDPSKGMVVAGVTEIEVESPEEIMDLLRRGNERRTTEPTAMNVTSSRSHAVLQIQVERREAAFMQASLGKLSLIDLAGSERASQTENRGMRLVEGANINKSLLALGNCINALASGSAFVPYRDSKLTRLVKDSLGGNCKTVMIANVSPADVSFEDTVNTLKYANRAKNIRVSAYRNMVSPDDHVNHYEKAIADLRSEALELRDKLAKLRAGPCLAGSEEEHEACEQWKAEYVQNLEDRAELQRSLIEVDRGLEQWFLEQSRALAAIAHLEHNPSATPSSDLHVASVVKQPRTLEEWRDHAQQVAESIRENMEARTSLDRRLTQNKVAGMELNAQLPHRVVNEDLRAFLELIQRMQIQQVERMKLDNIREQQRARLEQRDKEIATLRHQLRLRNEHLRLQGELLSIEQKEQLPNHVSVLGMTLGDTQAQKGLPSARLTHAWASETKDQAEIDGWDNRPLRERDPPRTRALSDGSDAIDNFLDLKNWELPRASRIRGIAGLAPGWRPPPELCSARRLGSPRNLGVATRQPVAQERLREKPATGGVGGRSAPQPPAIGKRGNTCPPQRTEAREVPRPHCDVLLERFRVARHRSRSEQPGSQMHRVGRIALQPRQQDFGALAGIPAAPTRFM